ncbi:major facilitator superfamily-domain-containing protein [Xylaria bambusicola]|uniref:major facilitator superfamily-domain-containing protein n=1 Tax=Xylaria bambusicola TaxID=326684 RepID=UPI002008D7B6|nr:major facilitator superfamily-domain-containing protein [Xylaria bambusicola]KAI0517000.1 major facilitator superfamily-domain-containing protein [Xylaria bambusicola]
MSQTDINIDNGDTSETQAEPESPTIDPRTWVVFIALCLAAFCVNLNVTILSTVLPLISRELNAQYDFIWITASFNIAAAAVQPLFGQAANVLGRRTPMLASLALFTLGSGVCGGSTSIGMLIAGRSIQGAGSGGVMMLLEVITADLFPLRIRAQYFGLVLAFCSLGVTLGPIVGGAVVLQTTWRWVFYLSVPFGGFALVLSVFFLRLKTPQTTWRAKLLRIDFVGNAIFIAATTSLLLGLIEGGQVYPWSSWRVIVPIVLGGIGFAIFIVFEFSPYCKEPTVSPTLFSNRTAATGFVIIFLSCLLLDWVVYFLPYYFQTMKGSTELQSGVEVLPFSIFLVPVAGLNGFLLTKFGRYKPLHWVGFGIAALAFGLFSTMNPETSKVEWVFWQLFASYGLGSLITVILPAIQNSLPEDQVATATGLHAFFRSVGFVWAFTVPSLIFNNQVEVNLDRVITIPSVRAVLVGGKAFNMANSDWFRGLSGTAKAEVLNLFGIAMKRIWYTALAFSLFGFLLVFLEKHIKLREHLDTEFGLEPKKLSNEKETSP